VVGSTLPDARARDRQLAARLMAGDPQALAQIYAEYGRFVFGVSTRVVRDDRMAEDVTQEVLTFLWEHPERYDPTSGSLRTWLGLLAHRRSVDRVRAETRRTRVETFIDLAESTECEADERLDREWMCRRVRRALDSLPADQRRALVLAYFEGHSYREVASDLAIPEGTAKSRIRLALNRMNAALRADFAEEGTLTWT
jgi:RNA polymerase sigma factor (sigma-70 family)